MIALQEVGNNFRISSPGNVLKQIVEDLNIRVAFSGDGECFEVAEPNLPEGQSRIPGSSYIANAFVYDKSRVELVSLTYLTDDYVQDRYPDIWQERLSGGGIFSSSNGSRPPAIAKFRDRSTGEEWVVVYIHLKSRLDSRSGRNRGGDVDRGDGQGAWNNQRLLAMKVILAEVKNERNVIIGGDWNAGPYEDPVRLLRAQGWIAPIDNFQHVGTYVHRGQAQTLDHVFVSKDVEGNVVKTVVFTGNAEGSSARNTWTDHCAVIVDLKFASALPVLVLVFNFDSGVVAHPAEEERAGDLKAAA